MYANRKQIVLAYQICVAEIMFKSSSKLEYKVTEKDVYLRLLMHMASSMEFIGDLS